MAFFAKFPTVFQTYETRYVRFRSKEVRNFLFQMRFALRVRPILNYP